MLRLERCERSASGKCLGSARVVYDSSARCGSVIDIVTRGMVAAMKRVLIAGASGRLGAHVTKELQRRGYSARALARDASRVRGADEVHACDARNADALRGACDGMDVVISTMGASLQLGLTRGSSSYHDVDYRANMNLLAEAERAGVRKFIYVSLCGAEKFRGLGYVDAQENFVEALRRSRLEQTVIRPTGFFYVVDEIFHMARRYGRVVVAGDGWARTNPVHEADVARECVDAVEVGEREMLVGGPETFTRREIAELAFHSLGRRPKITHISPALIGAVIRPVRLFDRRLYDFLAFGLAVSTTDAVAPASGKTSLKRHFRRLACEGDSQASLHLTSPSHAVETGRVDAVFSGRR